jgi:hypothetical protein
MFQERFLRTVSCSTCGSGRAWEEPLEIGRFREWNYSQQRSCLSACMAALIGSMFDAQHQFNRLRGICREDVGCSRLKVRASGTMIGGS